MLARLTLFSLFVAAAAPLWSDPPRPFAEAAVDIYTPAALDQQRLGGLFADRTHANIEGYLEHVDVGKLLQPFRQRAASGSYPADGEGAGLFLIAASNSYEYSDDPRLRAVMDRVVTGLLAAQSRDGYLGLYAAEQRWGPGDILTHAGVLLGLIFYSHVTGEDDTVTAARRAADLLLNTFGKGHAPPETVTLLPAFAELYRSTDDPHYLTFCRSLAESVSNTSGSTLVDVLHGYGLVELYRVTANDSYLKSAQAIWQRTEDTHPSLIGVPGSSDHVDSCLTLAWFQLTLDLLRLTGQVPYAQNLESTIYNALLPAQQVTTGNIDPSIPLAGKKSFTHNVDVCTSAVAVALSELSEVEWGRYGYGLAVLSYNPGRFTVRLRRRATVQVYSEGNYPETGAILLHVEPSHDIRFPLSLLVPAWTHSFTVDIGETHLKGQPGQFLKLTRNWRKGDTVKISIGMTAAVLSDPADATRVAVRRGPQILTLDSALNPDLKNATLTVSRDAAASLKEEEITVMPISAASGTYSIPASAAGAMRSALLVPFFSAANGRIWFAAPQ